MWETVPEEVGVGEDTSRGVRDELSNAVRAEDRKLLYVARVDGKIAGTSVIWVSRRDPKLAEFALPGTAPEFRRRGIGQALFDAPVADFTAMGGESIFLGASSYAFRTYMRAGYQQAGRHERPRLRRRRRVAGSLPRRLLPRARTGRRRPRRALRPDFLRASSAYAARLASDGRQRRSSLAPVQPAQWIRGPGREVRRAARRVGVDLLRRTRRRTAARSWASPRQSSRTACASVDGFTHPYYEDNWNELIESAAAWGSEHGAERCAAIVSEEDWRKREMFEALGFETAGRGDDFLLNGMQMSVYPNGKTVRSSRLERP